MNGGNAKALPADDIVAVVLIAAGGTGGHVFPALAVAEELRERGQSVVWLGTVAGLEARTVPEAGIELRFLRVAGLRGRGPVRWLSAPFMLLRSLFEALAAMRSVRPGVVLGMGGYVSGPVGIAAWLCRIPLVIHEQNAIPGTTNRLLAPLATAIMEAFPGSFPAVRGAEWVGNPLRRGFLAGEAQSHENQPVTSVLRILVLGGSQGAQALNETVPDALSQLSEGTETEVVHQCGPAHLEATSDAYRRAGVRAQVEGFINDMPMVYEWAQLVVCRAGAMTVAELAGRGVASILVPFPHAVDDHQSANAQFLVAAGAALVIPQTQLDGPRLARTIDALHQENGRLSEMGRRARGLAREDAAGRVAAQCLESAHV